MYMRASSLSGRAFGPCLAAALLAVLGLGDTALAETGSPPAQSGVAPTRPATETYQGVSFVVQSVGPPASGPESQRPLPLIVGLHGLGDVPENFLELLRELPLRARLAAARALTPYGQGYAWLPPSRPRNIDERAQSVQQAAARLAPALAALAAAQPSCGRPIVIGFSQGAMVAYGLAASARPALGAVFPIAGYLPPSLIPARAPALAPRIVALHGAADSVVGFRDDEVSVRGLNRAGYSIELRSYPGIDHRISPQMRMELAERVRSAVREMGCTP